MPRLLTLFLLLFFAMPAVAQEMPDTRGPEYWQGAYDRAATVTNAGLATGGIGIGVSIIASAAFPVDPDTLERPLPGILFGQLGSVGFQLGPAIAAGGSLRAHRALTELGHKDLPKRAGQAAWVSWGTALVTTYGGAGLAAYGLARSDLEAVIIHPTLLAGGLLALIGFGFQIAAYVSCFTQMAKNKQGAMVQRRSIDTGALPTRHKLQLVDVSPFHRDGKTGVSLTAVF